MTMCVAYCHRRGVLYWTHVDCSFEICPFVAEEPNRCASCRHREPAGDLCGLTRAPLPAVGGCCHWNVEPLSGPQWVTWEMLEPLGVGQESTADLLDDLDAPYGQDEFGQIWIDPDCLGLPEIYGLGTETLEPDALDWSEWEAVCDGGQ